MRPSTVRLRRGPEPASVLLLGSVATILAALLFRRRRLEHDRIPIEKRTQRDH